MIFTIDDHSSDLHLNSKGKPAGIMELQEMNPPSILSTQFVLAIMWEKLIDRSIAQLSRFEISEMYNRRPNFYSNFVEINWVGKSLSDIVSIDIDSGTSLGIYCNGVGFIFSIVSFLQYNQMIRKIYWFFCVLEKVWEKQDCLAIF